MSIYKKLQQARIHIKEMDLKKQGRNDYSKYDYYTPEQINFLVNQACNKVGLMTKFDLIRDDLGIYGKLTIIDIDNTTDLNPEIVFLQATDIPVITATNIAQQIGGAVTYTHRYLNMTAFDIVDNSLDFDTTENTKKTDKKSSTKEPDKKWLNVYNKKDNPESGFTKEFTDCHKAIHEQNFTIVDIRKKYMVSKDVAKELEEPFRLTEDLPL